MARFTDRQIEDAKRTDLARFLQSRGEKLMPSGAEYRWVYRDASGEHDSVTVRGGEWFDHKRQIGGDAIGFLQEFYGMDFRPAVAMLLGVQNAEPTPRDIVAYPRNGTERKPFALPTKADNTRRLYAYLCKTRCIDHEVVSHFVRAGALYEDAEYHNAVFLATDEQGKPLGGMKKSTLSGSGFRQTIAGSDTCYAFHYKGKSEQIYVFEAAVDLLSFITLHPQDWQRHSYLALDGVSSKALHHFLATHEDVRDVCLCLDNDEAGRKATERISAELYERGYRAVSVMAPTTVKDWNEMLVTQIMTCNHDSPEVEMTMG